MKKKKVVDKKWELYLKSQEYEFTEKKLSETDGKVANNWIKSHNMAIAKSNLSDTIKRRLLVPKKNQPLLSYVKPNPNLTNPNHKKKVKKPKVDKPLTTTDRLNALENRLNKLKNVR